VWRVSCRVVCARGRESTGTFDGSEWWRRTSTRLVAAR
jgi:hypothetical protein